VCGFFSPPFQEKAAAMRFSFARSGLLCGSLVLLSGCYSNGKMHAPTWGDMAWWKKDKAPASSSLAGPSVTRPSEEASLASKGSPGEKAGMAPSYEGSPASYNAAAGKSATAPGGGAAPSASASAIAAAAADRYPNTGAPVVNPGAPSSGGANWSANGPGPGAAATNNRYAAGNSAGGSPYATSGRYDAPAASAAPSGAAQTAPYDPNYQGASSYTGGNTTSRDMGTARSASSASIAGAHENPYYNDSTGGAPRSDATSSGAPRGDRYSNDRYNNDRYANDNAAAGQAGGDAYDGAKYRETNGTQYADERAAANSSVRSEAPRDTMPRDATFDNRGDARSYGDGSDRTADSRNVDSRNVDSRNVDSRSADADYDPGRTGYQPNGSQPYEMPGNSGSTDVRSAESRTDSRSAAQGYQPGGTSRYQSGSRTSDNFNSEAPARRYNDTPSQGDPTRRF
jgi:hypothetical protein